MRASTARQPDIERAEARGFDPRVVVPGERSGRPADARMLVRATRAEMLAERQATVLAIVLELLGPSDTERALDAFVGVVQQRLGADRVALGLVTDTGALELRAISQQALVDVATAEARLLVEVMEECLEHERVVCVPETDDVSGALASHRALAGRRERTVLASVPLYRETVAVGALLLERHDAEPLRPGTRELLEQIALAAAAPLALRRDAERGATARARATVRTAFARRLGGEHVGARLMLGLLAGALVLAALVPLPRQVTAAAELVPRERRLVSAPFDGFVETVAVEPGERVSVGQSLARLERGELELEGARRDGEIASAEARYRVAMADHDRQATAVARALLERERALRALVEQRLERVELRAPMAGLVVSGDPGNRVGVPVTRGETLFEIARIDGYEVHVMVHERDIREVHEGQRGTLTLRARPGEELALLVHAIHPVAESVRGASRFRVRATLEVPPGVVPRPGESGVARLDVERASLVRTLGQPLGQRLTELWWKLSG